MKPEADQILGISAGQLLGGVVPILPNSYAQGSTSVLAFLMMFAAAEYERGADIRATDNAEMRTLFRELSPQVSDGELKAKLEDAAASAEPSLLISALNANNAKLCALVIALQTHFEDRGDARAREKRIWQVLQASAARRLVKTPGS